MVSKYAIVATLSAAVIVNAQTDPFAQLPLSSGCKTAVQGLTTSKVASCLNLQGLFAILATPATQSYVGPVDTWLTGLCNGQQCSTADINSAFDSLQTACASDFKLFGITTEAITMVKASVSTYYPTVRKIVCLKEGSTLCITSSLKAYEKAVGQPLSPATFMGNPNAFNNVSIPKDVACTQCTKAAYAIIKQDIPAIGGSYDQSLTQQCGADFLKTAATGVSSGPSTGSSSSDKAPAGSSNSWALSAPAIGSSLIATVFSGILLA